MNKKLLVLGFAAVTSLGAFAFFSNNVESIKVGANPTGIENGTIVINKETLMENPTRPGDGGYVTTAHGNKITFYTSNRMNYGEDDIFSFSNGTGLYILTPIQSIIGVTVDYYFPGAEGCRFVVCYGTYSGDFTKSETVLTSGVEALNDKHEFDTYNYISLWHTGQDINVTSVTIRYSCAY